VAFLKRHGATHPMSPRSKQRGFAILIWVLMIAFLIGLIGSAVLRGPDLGGALIANQFVASLNTQAAVIRTRILSCATDYPQGNNLTAFNPRYPAAPTAVAVASLICPGSTQALWNNADGITLPPRISGLGDWSYTNDATSLRISITATAAERVPLLSNAAQQLGPQATVVDATLTWTLAAAIP
jgi:Tfp pilus assembly protein PilX